MFSQPPHRVVGGAKKPARFPGISTFPGAMPGNKSDLPNGTLVMENKEGDVSFLVSGMGPDAESVGPALYFRP